MNRDDSFRMWPSDQFEFETPTNFKILSCIKYFENKIKFKICNDVLYFNVSIPSHCLINKNSIQLILNMESILYLKNVKKINILIEEKLFPVISITNFKNVFFILIFDANKACDSKRCYKEFK